MKVIAHRGGSGLGGVENTMDAFVNAIKLGVDMVEFDVRRTKDNALIVIHDSEIDGRKISEMTFDEIICALKEYSLADRSKTMVSLNPLKFLTSNRFNISIPP